MNISETKFFTKVFILIFLFSQNCFSQESCSSSTLEDWYYQMDGNLEDSTLSCTGIVHISHFFNDNNDENIKWDITKLACRGYQEVDWLHDMGDSGKIYFSNDSWQIENYLPGLGTCKADVYYDDKMNLDSIIIYCEWKCRNEDFPCSGEAKYTFKRNN